MTYSIYILTSLLSLIALLIIYHHIGYPLILRWWVRRQVGRVDNSLPVEITQLPELTVVMPAYNEGEYIAKKLFNLASVEYPRHLLKIIVACDGCTDETVSIAKNTISSPDFNDLNIEVIDNPSNHGKISVLNRHLPLINSGVIALTDVSAQLSKDAFIKAAQHFQLEEVGVVAGTYQLTCEMNSGEAAYWKYQVSNKIGESALGAPLGVHGALYFIRAGLFQRLKADTINDDFIIPMQIVAKGFRALYDTKIISYEDEIAEQELDFNRRKRISAGNLQQVFRVPQLLSPKFKGISFAFISGKALRAFMPFLLIVFLLGSVGLSIFSFPWKWIVGIEVFTTLLVLWRHYFIAPGKFKFLDIIHYIALGHFAGLIGGTSYLLGLNQSVWTSTKIVKDTKIMKNLNHENKPVAIAKRTFDIFGAIFGLCLILPLVPLISLAILLESKGPIIFKQTRVGRAWSSHTEIFSMFKFRTMCVDAEEKSGPVWASKSDPRITKVGWFLRKTRLDEVPQLINVLKGDMSLVGPRPERPGIYDKLEEAIPYYADRTYGVRPGITGLAQVFQGYDETIEDVRSKVSYDHAYALASGNIKSWFLLDIEILIRTVAVVICGRGQ